MNIKRFVKIDLLILIGLVLLAGFLRFYKISEIPCGLYPDQALNGVDALKFAGGKLSPVYGNREGIIIYLVALSHLFFGTGAWQIFVVSAFIGTLTVATTYLAVKEFFNRKVAFLTSFFLAVSSWHIALSRNGFRANLLPLVITLFAFFILKSLRAETTKDKKIYYTLTACTFALGFYTYNAFILFVFGLLCLSAFGLFKYGKKVSSWLVENRKNLLLPLISFGLIVFPIVLFIIIFPEKYFGRANQVSIFSQAENLFGIVKFLFKNFLDTFSGIFTHGDFNWRHNVSGQPLLPLFLTPFFFIGLFWSIYKKGKYLVSPFIFFIMLLPGILTSEGTPPHGLRIIGIIPLLFVFCAIALVWIWDNLKNKFLLIGARIFLVLLLGWTAMVGYGNYFKEAPNSLHFYEDFRCDLPELADYLEVNPKAIVIIDDFSFESLRYIFYPETFEHYTPEHFLANSENILRVGVVFVLASSYGDEDDEVRKLLEGKYEKVSFENFSGKEDFAVFGSEK